MLRRLQPSPPLAFAKGTERWELCLMFRKLDFLSKSGSGWRTIEPPWTCKPFGNTFLVNTHVVRVETVSLCSSPSLMTVFIVNGSSLTGLSIPDFIITSTSPSNLAFLAFISFSLSFPICCNLFWFSISSSCSFFSSSTPLGDTTYVPAFCASIAAFVLALRIKAGGPIGTSIDSSGARFDPMIASLNSPNDTLPSRFMSTCLTMSITSPGVMFDTPSHSRAP
mmetsp:Transcript_11857/g.21654  ORF Transcript_11857/g.21654 Transcript_11857/m.21654 type:complete len:223 (-) Transcript_11857:151-819(-)